VINLQQLLKTVVKQNASDLHLSAGSAPALRIDSRIVRVKSRDLTPDDVRKLCYSVLTDDQRARFETDHELDFSFGIKGMARFRVNLFFQRGSVSGVFRRVPIEPPDLALLGLPSIVNDIANFPNGLVLVTGPTGSGKTTTLAGIIDKINKERRGHIITIEDPIEYIFPHRQCVVNQREVTVDTASYKSAMKHLLRQDPDVCLIGELRDQDSIETSLQVAETGHLVFATLHTNSAIQTLNRLVGVFPSDQQERIRNQLALSLNAVLSQRLLPAVGGGVVAACEVLILNSSIRSLIRENKLHQVYGMMQVGQNKSGMMTLNQSLMNLILKRKVDIKVAFEESPDVDELDSMLKKAGI
jgi:twitching motility protein PilT